MSEAARKILEEALRLSAEERSLLARQLLDSVAAANDAMEPEELAALEEALDDSERQFAAGEGHDFFTAIAELRARS
jgi:hypothetical protein